MAKPSFTPIEKNIMRFLYQAKARVTAYRIAKYLNISHQTAKKYLHELYGKKIVDRMYIGTTSSKAKKGKTKVSVHYWFNFKILEEVENE